MNRRTALRIATCCGTVYAVFCLLIFLVQRRLLFFPSHRDDVSSRLTPWLHEGGAIGYCREVRAPRTVWLMMHGNAGQASDRDYVLEHISAEDALYVLEYPGYGTRDGSPSRRSMDSAASAAYHALQQRYPDTPLCIIGESIGSGPACGLAKERVPPAKIVLITPFDTLCRVASKRFWFLPVQSLLLDRWDNIGSLQYYEGPIDIYGASGDTVIPVEHAENLARKVPSARYTEIPGGHNDWSFSAAVEIDR